MDQPYGKYSCLGHFIQALYILGHKAENGIPEKKRPPRPMVETPFDITKYFGTIFPTIPAPTSIVPLTGGEINYVYRVSFCQPIDEFAGASSVVVKLSLGKLVSQPEVAFGLERQTIEARAMAFLVPMSTGLYLPLSFPNPYLRVKTPILYHFSPQQNVIVMQDMGLHPDLQQYLLDSTTVQRETYVLGELLGNYLSSFHNFTKEHISELIPYFTNNAARTLLQDAFYSEVAPLISRATLPTSRIVQLSERTKNFGFRGTLDPATSTKVVRMGDLWPGAVLISSSRQELIVLDWEFCDVGNPATEVGHFVTFLYLLANFPPCGKGSVEGMTAASAFMKGFLETYARKIIPVDTRAFWKDVQVMIGIELLIEAGKGRWCSIESCACEGECFFVDEDGAKGRKICINKIVDIGIKLMEEREEVLEKVLGIDLNAN